MDPFKDIPNYTHAPYDTTTTATQLTQKYTPEIKDKIVLVVGPTRNSIGGEFAVRIAAAQPKLIILAGRNTTKLQQTADAITASDSSTANKVVDTRILQVDLLSLASVRKAATELLSWDDGVVPRIDVVMLNAGIMATEYALSADGLESQFATNHLGPFLLVNLLMPKVLASTAPRIVVVSSNGQRYSPIRWGDYNFSVSSCNQYHGRSWFSRVLTVILLFIEWRDLQQMARLRPIQDGKQSLCA